MTPLLRHNDFSWAVEQVRTAPSPAEQSFWVAIVSSLFRSAEPDHVAILYEALPTCPPLGEAFGTLFDPVCIASPQADAMRANYRHWQELEERGRQSRRRQLLEPPLPERLANLLGRFEAGNLDAW